MALLPGPKMVLLRSFPGVTRLSDPQSSVWLGGLGYGKCRQELSHSSQQNQWLQKSGYPCKVLCGPGPWNEVCHLLSISTAKAASGSPMLSVEATLLSGDGFFTSCLLVGPGDVFSLVHLTIKSHSFRTFLGLQWLRPCASNARGVASIPGWELRSHMSCAAKKLKTKKQITAVYSHATPEPAMLADPGEVAEDDFRPARESLRPLFLLWNSRSPLCLHMPLYSL